ncbi:hypothetical protein [Roseivivax marinus]|uniref:hypothetical protein n=1 Tax=Roseivivax marinus TaxID=1379903 RepID=UPI00273F64C0|nr:hypothetical protein [Roseivivax marinus]
MPKSEDVHVTLSASHTYRTGPATTRTLPPGWTGYVPETVAKEIEKQKTGKRTPAKDRPWEGEASGGKGRAKGDAGQGGSTGQAASATGGAGDGGGSASGGGSTGQASA